MIARIIELSARNYQMDTTFGRHLLDLDRRIHELPIAGDGSLSGRHPTKPKL